MSRQNEIEILSYDTLYMKKDRQLTVSFLNYRPRSYYKLSQIFLVHHFSYGFIITVAGVERPHPWGYDPFN